MILTVFLPFLFHTKDWGVLVLVPAMHLIRNITRIYRELRKLNIQKNSDPVKKLANELNRSFLKEEV
jgi:hypothetical protein